MYKTPLTARTINRLKIVFSFLVLGFLVFKFVERYDSIGSDLFNGIKLDLSFIVLLFLLTLLNLSFESKKWISLMGELSFPKAIGAVLQGMAAGFVTPNRIGEFAGRMAALPEGYRTKGGLMTVVGSIIQGGVTFVFGALGLLIFPYQNIIATLNLDFSNWLLASGVFLILAVVGIIARKKIGRHINQAKSHLSEVTLFQGLKAFGFAMLRYAVFASQYALCLLYCGFEGDLIILISGITTAYFIQSYMPFGAFGELGIREILAVLIFGAFMPSPLNAAMATLILWLFNIALPVLIGILIQKRLIKA